MAERGRWVRGFGYRYWEGACMCGSGKEGHELYDKMGVYAGITCSTCRKELGFAPGIMPGDPAPYQVDEPIEED
jgi:hypothetical protein